MASKCPVSGIPSDVCTCVQCQKPASPPTDQIAAIRAIAQKVCRLRSDDCCMDERPYPGDCTYENCNVMQGVKALIDIERPPSEPAPLPLQSTYYRALEFGMDDIRRALGLSQGAPHELVIEEIEKLRQPTEPAEKQP